MDTYNPHAIESKWQQVWDAEGAFEVQNPEPGAPRNPLKRYVLEMLPYPSGSLHMGHMLVYTLGDVRTHFYRRNGFEVLRPMGFDSFGLPAENAAINDGGHPREIVERNIDAIRRTMKTIGWAIDWPRQFSTHEPEYYRWTQWLFLQLYAAGLAVAPNGAGQVVPARPDCACERAGPGRTLRALRRTGRVAQHRAVVLQDDRATPISCSTSRRSDGPSGSSRPSATGSDGPRAPRCCSSSTSWATTIPVFTTRPDTLFGATFFVLAPEHPLVERSSPLGGPRREELREYVRVAAAKRGEERAAGGAKSGIYTGLVAVNPVNDERIPVFVADYVLMDYGTGAIMAVPAHDERDFEFARTFGLTIRPVVVPRGEEAAADAGDARTSLIPTTRC